MRRYADCITWLWFYAEMLGKNTDNLLGNFLVIINIINDD